MLKDKIIVVTGGSGLLGKEIVADIKRKNGIPIIVDLFFEGTISDNDYKVDITNNGSVDEFVNKIFVKYTRIDGLVNCAYPRTEDWGNSFENIAFRSWQINIDMQMNSVFYILQQTLKYMKIHNKGSIVNIASIYGVVGNDFTLYEDYGGTSPAAYSAIKGGIINLTRYLASYYGRHNIRINCVSPGGIKDEKNQHPSFIEKYEKKVPLGRLGKPDDIAPAVSFLLSDEAKYITGQNIVIDGGWTII